MHDLSSIQIHMWPISVCVLRGSEETGRANRESPRKHTADLTVRVGGVGIHWQTEDRRARMRRVAPAAWGGVDA
jgi:hypothetical protein